MQKQKNHYYVLVFTTKGPKFVTSINNATKTAEWNGEEKPLELSKEYANDVVIGLCLNGFNSVLICSKWEQEQPYNYGDYECTFEKKEN